MKDIKDLLQKNCISYLIDYVLSFQDKIFYKVIESIIYSIIDNFICLDYLGIVEHKLSTHNKKLKNEIQ